MPDDAKKTWLSQILVGVSITLLAGGTAPWWWGELMAVLDRGTADAPDLPRESGSPAAALSAYETIQKLYESARSLPAERDCGDVRTIVEKIRVHADSPDPVPPSFAYTVRYPQGKTAPTIGDLATDRITRIESQRAGCFGAAR